MNKSELLIENLKKAMAEFSKVAGPEKAKSTIDKFTELKNRNQFKDPIERDINHWRDRGWEAFSNRVDTLSKRKTDTQISSGKDKGNVIMVWEDANWTIVIPLDKEASVYYGKGTKWCTTKPMASYYEEYVYQDGGTLIYAIDKIGSGDRSVAILIKSNGEIDRFNKEDKKIDVAEYYRISGLDHDAIVKRAQLPENKSQIDNARDEFNKKLSLAKAEVEKPKLDYEEAEDLLKTVKDPKLCYEYIIKRGKEQNKKFTVHPIILIAASIFIETAPKQHWTTASRYIDYSKIPNSAFKTIARSKPIMIIMGNNNLNAEQINIISKESPAAFYYAKYVVGGKWPAGEAAIATSGENSYEYATKITKMPFPEGEAAIRENFTDWSRYQEFFSKPRSGPDQVTASWTPPKDISNQLLPASKSASAEYWYDNRGTQKGPVSREQLLDLAKRRVINKSAYVWRSGLKEWVYLSQLEKELIPVEEKIYKYVINDAMLGPVTKTYLHKLLTGNQIDNHTLVWRPGMKGWQEISSLMKEITPVKTEGRYTQRRNINAYNITQRIK